MIVLLVVLSSIEALLLAAAGAWLLISAAKSSDFDGEERERAMFRALAETTGKPPAAPEAVDMPPSSPFRQTTCPEMPDLARLGAALAVEGKAEAQSDAVFNHGEAQPEAVYNKTQSDR